MATDNSTETLQDISKRLDDAYQEALDVITMLYTLRDAHHEEMPGHMAEIILKRTENLSGELELAARDLKEAGGAK